MTLPTFTSVKGLSIVKIPLGSSLTASEPFGFKRLWLRLFIAISPSRKADAIFSKPMGIPKTGVFGLVDLVGLDLIPLVTQSMRNALPKTDRFHTSYKDIPVIQKLIDDGYTGR